MTLPPLLIRPEVELHQRMMRLDDQRLYSRPSPRVPVRRVKTGYRPSMEASWQRLADLARRWLTHPLIDTGV